MKKILILLVLASLGFTSCKKEETAEAPPTEEAAADTTAVATDSTNAATATPAQMQPGTNPGNGSVMSANPQTTTQSYTTTAGTAAAAKGMNPAHGQPGHRCDIAVGAPLNSPPGKKTAATSTPTVSQSTTVTPAMLQNGTLTPGSGTTVTTSSTPAAAPTTPVVTAPGMNPPHGQEGHVCSVAVGAPLPKKE